MEHNAESKLNYKYFIVITAIFEYFHLIELQIDQEHRDLFMMPIKIQWTC